MNPCVKFDSESTSVSKFDFGGDTLVFHVSLPSKQAVLAHMAVCRNPREMIQIYDKAGGAMRAVENDEVDLLGNDMSASRPFFFKYFKGLTDTLGNPLKSPATVEAQADWIKNHPYLRIPESVVMQGLFSLEINREEEEAAEDFFESDEVALDTSSESLGDETFDASEGGLELDLFSDDFSSVKTLFSSVDPGTGLVVKTPLTWRFSACTERENLMWQRATGQSRMDTRKRTIRRKVDHLAVLKLFNESVEEVEGGLFEGQPCTVSNREKWIGSVNYGWVYTIMSMRFSGVTLKNE